MQAHSACDDALRGDGVKDRLSVLFHNKARKWDKVAAPVFADEQERNGEIAVWNYPCKLLECLAAHLGYDLVLKTRETRLVCAKCGACAEHEDDRVDGRCQYCNGEKTVTQERSGPGKPWQDKKEYSTDETIQD